MRKALFALLLASCGDNALTKMPLANFLSARHLAECERLTRCGLFTSEPICNSYFRHPSDASLIEAVAANKIRYDGVAAFDCLTALAATSCDTTQRDARLEPLACEPVFEGDVPDGERCAFDGECRSGVCNEPICTRDTCCPETCAATIASPIDGPCEINEQCEDGAYCSKKSNTCRLLVAENKSCDDPGACEFGLACVGVTDLDNGTCRKLPLLGESCPYKLCAELNATCSADFICVARGLPGASCLLDRDCSPFAECDQSTGECIDTPRLGEACVVYCAGDSWCDALTCSAPLPNGEMCTADDQCTSLYCAEGVVFDSCTEPAVCF